MSSKIFLQALQSKLKGGNSRSIHLNALPGRFATRLDLKHLDIVKENLSEEFLNTLLSKPNFEFKISFDHIDLNEVSSDVQKKLGLISKRLNSIIIENEDYYKEHGIKTLAFGYPILIKRSLSDPSKIIKAPLFIWPLEAIKSKSKVNEWSFLRNKAYKENGKLTDTDIHSVSINEVLLSFIKGEDGVALPNFTSEALEDFLIDSTELLDASANVLDALNSGFKEHYLTTLKNNFKSPVNALPDASSIDTIANNNAYIHFGGVFGLFRAQKESIITDITRLLDRFEEFEFDNLHIESLSSTPYSAVSTDPTQQAIINKLGIEANQIIQGPPGTGKSQSLSALITNALANDLKCLVVCEKKTALNVIKKNLQQTSASIASLVGVIDDVNDDRETIVDSVRERQNGIPFSLSLQQAYNQYETINHALHNSVNAINAQHTALSKPIYRDNVWTQLVGRYLKLKKKYTEVPLKDVLRASDFAFNKNEKELEEIKQVLGQADFLYHQLDSKQETLNKLVNDLFLEQKVGEIRLKIEEFISFGTAQIPHLRKFINQEIEFAKDWHIKKYSVLHHDIKDDLQPYVLFIEGNNFIKEELPVKFNFEKSIEQVIESIQELLIDANKLKQDYKQGLQQHYDTYNASVKNSIAQYISFVNINISQFGNLFFKNTSGARITTNALGVFSNKYKTLKQNRLDLRARVSIVREAHTKKKYVQHEYNDSIDVKNLSEYVSNIEELSSKFEQWDKKYPIEISAYLDQINDRNFHPDFIDAKSQLQSLLEKFEKIEKVLRTKYDLNLNEEVYDLNSLIKVGPLLIEKLDIFKRSYQDFRETYQDRIDVYKKIIDYFSVIENSNGSGKIIQELLEPYQTLDEALALCDHINSILSFLTNSVVELRKFHEWKVFFLRLPPNQQQLINKISEKLENSWVTGFECWYLFLLLSLNEPDNLPKSDYELFRFKELKNEFNEAQIDSIIVKWTRRQNNSVRQFKAKGHIINSLFNKKGSKGLRRNSLRTIIKSEFDLFTDFFPVLLLNPSVCSSILPLEEGIFDLVIFDEASQLRLEDTYAALIRGKAKIVSGDKHQMAPSSYFEGGGTLLDPIDENETDEEDNETSSNRNATNSIDLNLADKESLLAYAEDKGYSQSYLEIHYRSRHPFLIDFSNHAFYGERLIPVPAKQNYIPIHFLQVNGIYEGQVNKQEALKVIEILQNEIELNPDGSYPSIGVATFNIYQRNLILEEIGKARQIDPVFDTMMSKLGEAFFVKNLENIQGDERDVIILSTTFGRKNNDSFTQNFGPIIQGKGHRMLNVIITRARHKFFICTSFPPEYVAQYSTLLQKQGNKGRAILYSYLTYAKAVSEGNEDLRNGLLNTLTQYCSDKRYDNNELSIGSESPFEEEVYDRLAKHIGRERIIQQYKVGGFRIDMVILSKQTGKPIIALECDGAKYHSSPEAYAWDMFRQEQLEQYGFIFYRLWSTKWWDSADKEMDQMLNFIREQDTSSVQ